ncbi:MAG: cysteine-rich CWC family protein [Burkholderiales bacterium]|nr:cysteine-rich CWC family protein [Burkholderiales bacterium]
MIDPGACPLCGQANQCAMELERATGVKQTACWCTQVTMGAELLSGIPADAVGKACICPSCARAVTAVCATLPDSSGPISLRA